MATIKRNWWRYLLGLVLVPPILVLLLGAMLYVPAVQDWAVGLVEQKASEALGMDVRIAQLRLVYPLDLSAREVLIERSAKDTFAYIGRVDMRISPRPLLDKQAILPHIELERLSYHERDSLGSITKLRLGRAQLGDLALNLPQEHIRLSSLRADSLDVYYHSTDTTPSPESKPLAWRLDAEELIIANSRVSVDMPLHKLDLESELGYLGLRGLGLDLGRKSYALKAGELRKTSLAYAVDSLRKPSPYFDYTHLRLRELNLELGKSLIDQEVIDLVVERGEAEDHSGLKLQRLQGHYYQDSLRMRLDHLALSTSHSEIKGQVDLPHKILKGDTEAILELQLKSRLGAEDIRLLAGPYLQELGGSYRELAGKLSAERGEALVIDLDASGSLADMELKQAQIRWPQVLQAEAKGQLEHLLNHQRRRGRIELSASLGKEAGHLLALAPKSISQSYQVPVGLALEGDLDISKENIDIDLSLRDGPGSAELDGIYNIRDSRYKLDLILSQLQLGHFLRQSPLGGVTARLSAEGQGFDPLAKSTYSSLTGRVDALEFRGQSFGELSLDASLKRGEFGLALNSFNPGLNLSLVMDGLLSKRSISSSLSLHSQELDLKTLGLSEVPMGATFSLEGELYSDMADTHRLRADIRDMHLQLDGESIKPEQVALVIETHTSESRASLESGDLRLALQIEEAPSKLGQRSQELGLLAGRIAREVQSPEAMKLRLEQIIGKLPRTHIDLELGKENALRSYLAQYRTAVERIEGHIVLDPKQGIQGQLTARDIRRDTLRINCIDLALDTKRTARPSDTKATLPDSMRLVLDLQVDKTRFRQQEGFQLALELEASLQDALLSGRMLGDRGELRHALALSATWPNESYQIDLLGEELVLAGQRLQIEGGKWARLRKDDYFFSSDIQLRGEGRSSLQLLAQHDEAKSQEAKLIIRGLELERYRELGLGSLSGTLVGDLNYYRQGSIKEQATINGDLAIQGLRYEDKALGHFSTAFFYEPRNNSSHYITADVSHEGNQVLSIDGTYTTSEKDNPLAAKLQLKGFPLELANPFTAQNATYLSGSVHGALDLSGSASQPKLLGAIRTDKGQVELREYATKLKLDSLDLILDEDKLRLNRYALRPSADPENPIYINGSIGLSGKEAMKADLLIQAEEATLMNEPQPKTEGQLLYGRLIASADMRLTGKLNALKIRGSLGVRSGTNATYMMRESALDLSDKSSGLVRFVDFADTLFTATPIREAELGGVDLQANISIDPTVRFNVDLTSDGRDYMRMQGGGSLQLRYLPYGEMSLRGRYEMSGGGTLMYTLPVVGSKLFNIDPSGYIRFDGDVRNPYIDFVATQKVRAATGESGGAKTNFLVSIKMKDKIENINLAFDLSAPENLSVQNSLSAMSSEERGKQAIGLLATGTYLGSSSGGNKLNLNETFSALLQNQINTMAGNLLQGTDLSIGMEMNDGATGMQDMSYTYSFSRRFYNDRIRVVVGGKIHTGNTSASREQSLIDNLALEYQLDKAGERFMQLYHKRVTDNVIEGEYNETGFGLLLRRKLNRLSELFRFKRRAKRIQLDTLQPKPMIRQFTLPLFAPSAKKEDEEDKQTPQP